MIFRGETFNRIDRSITGWLSANGLNLLRISVGIIFIWFGVLKFFDGLSPAQDLAIGTIQIITFGIFSSKTIIWGLAVWELLIGIGLIFNLMLRETLLLLLLQMVGTFTPIFFFPDEVFAQPPFVLTLEGQYIIKNLIIVSAAMVIGATVRGGKLTSS